MAPTLLPRCWTWTVAILFVCMLAIAASHTMDDDFDDDDRWQFVTCGSIIKMGHSTTKYRLHSHQIPYGTGSQQQSVTAFPNGQDPNSLWAVMEAMGDEPCVRGRNIRCGSTLRLFHANTQTFLHSHLHESPLSGNQEISAFGNRDSSDTGDNWELECAETFWVRGSKFRLKHVDTGAYLSSNRNYRFNRPISGQQEVYGSASKSKDSLWRVEEGVFVHPDPDADEDGDEMGESHDEL